MLFKTEDVINEYFSPIGNADVPYPYAVGTENVYLMIEDAYTSLSNFANRRPVTVFQQEATDQDPYQTYYGHVPNEIEWNNFHNSMSDEREDVRNVIAERDAKIAALEKKLRNIEMNNDYVKGFNCCALR